MLSVIYSECCILVQASGACTIKHYGFVMYDKWTDFVTSYCLILPITNTLILTNTLAYYGIGTL
jgi:hypothetical protein